MISIYKSLVRPCLEYASHVLGGSTHTALLNRVESKAIRLINSSPLTDFNLLKSAAMLLPLLSFIAISMLTALFNLLNACLHPTRGLAAHEFIPVPITMLTDFLLQELTSIFSISCFSLVNSGTAFLRLYFLLSSKQTLSREEYQDTSGTKTDHSFGDFPCLLFL